MEAQESQEVEDRRDLEQCRSGDAAAFERLYRRHAPRVYGLALRTLRREDRAEDVVQETFLQLHRNAGSFRGEAKVGTWLCSIALNACRMRLRSERRTPLPLEEAAAVAAPVERTSSGALTAALAALDPDSRELVLLSAQGHSYDEVGAILGLSTDQVRGRLHRARKTLLEGVRARGGVDA